MSVNEMLMAAAGAAGAPVTYVDDVFSTYLYTGNGSTQTIANGIDLAGKGGMVWIKSRSTATDHAISDTARGTNQTLVSNSSQGPFGDGSIGINSFNSNGFTTSTTLVNESSSLYASWTFRKQAKFFDVVTYTGDGTNRNITHNLGSVPGMIIVKATSTTNNWRTYHRSLGNSAYVSLNTTDAQTTGSSIWNNTSPTSSVFSVGSSGGLNVSSVTYVAYLFAHDAGGFGSAGTDNVISCGSYVGTGDGAGNNITLGFEPQFVFVKNSSATSDWRIIDAIRGTGNAGLGAAQLSPNDVATETGTDGCWFTPTGFTLTAINTEWNTSGNTYIYMAIRRPMKPPTSGTEVFQPVAYTGNNVDNRLVNTGIVTDMTMARRRSSSSTLGFVTGDRLRGNAFLGTAVTNAETTDPDSLMTPTVSYGNSFSAMNGFGVGNDTTRLLNGSSTTQLAYAFKRATGFFDEVCYTGTGSARTVAHNLGVVPELMIVKQRDGVGRAWAVYASPIGNTDYLSLNSIDGKLTNSSYWNNTTPTSSVFTVGTNVATNNANINYVAYLFTTLAGISKVGSYTGNGTSQTINAALPTGARFVLIKRTDNVYDWWVWDTARGMVSGTDPRLAPNSAAAELNNNWVYTATNGFQIVTSDAAVNELGGSYIYLAIAQTFNI